MVVPVPGRRAVRRGKYCTHRLSARSRRNHVHYDTRPPYGLLPGRCSSLGVLVLKRPACTARSARCLKRTQGAKDCTASNAAIRRLWAWRVSHIALSGWSTSPPHGPTDPWTRANTAPPRCRVPGRGPQPGNTAHARRAPSVAGRDPCSVAGRAFGHASDGAGSGIGRPPGIMPPT